MGRFELPTSRSRTVRSTKLSHTPKWSASLYHIFGTDFNSSREHSRKTELLPLPHPTPPIDPFGLHRLYYGEVITTKHIPTRT